MAFVNVGGLELKLAIPEFHSFIQNYDIVGLVETKLNKTIIKTNDRNEDTTSIPGYTIFHKFRKARSSWNSGGIALAIKNSLKEIFDVKIVNTDLSSDNVLWCEFRNFFNCSNKPLIIGVAYISPQGSPYSNHHSFTDIESDYLNNFVNYENCFIVGDFNAHIKNKSDLTCDLEIAETDEIYDNVLLQHDNMYNQLVNNNMSITRASYCTQPSNTWGQYFLNLVKSLNLCIINGRINDNSGKCTTTNSSVVDYLLSNSNMLPHFKNLTVLDFCPILSDVHMSLEITIINTRSAAKNMYCENQPCYSDNIAREVSYKANKWEISKANELLENISRAKLQEIINTLNSTSEDAKQIMDKVCSDIHELFDKSCKDTFGIRKVTKTTNKAKTFDDKPDRKSKKFEYFNKECEYKRSIFHRSKKRYNITKSAYDFKRMKEDGKDYKKELRSAQNTHNRNIRNNVKQLRKSKNTRDYWTFVADNKKNSSLNGPDDENLQNFYQFFKELNSCNDLNADDNIDSPPFNSELDMPITKDEIIKCIKKLKSNKASGIDNISNEFIKASSELMIDIYVSLFNIVFSSGQIPSTWTTGKIKPIYKKKGNKSDPDNYRPITLLSCLGKLFTAVINDRLKTYSENNHIIGEEQLGFRNGYSTIDGTFILHTLINIMGKNKKALYAVFIDLKKAFPSISRPLLFKKLSQMPIGTNVFKCIKSMYDNIKSCVEIDGNTSELFDCQIGLREGENLSPILFSFYLNDLKDNLILNADGISVNYNNQGIEQLLKISLIMYADDTVLLSDSRVKLQNLLNCYINYCENWKLCINPDKTKVIIFGKNYSKPNIKIYGKNLEVVNSFKYLGITFNKSGRMMQSIKDNIEKARKAFYAIMNRCKDKSIPLDCKLELFSKCIEPILLYGCELWGIEDHAVIETFRLKCYKIMMKAKSCTPSYMIYGEMGLLPLNCYIHKRMISYWTKVVSCRPDMLIRQLYNIMYAESVNNVWYPKWLERIKHILLSSGFGYLWNLQTNIRDIDKKQLQSRLNDIALQQVIATCRNSNKGNNYLALKKSWTQETYLTILDDKNALYLFKFRTANHRLPVESGRFNGTEYKDRICQHCFRDIGDEFHYLLMCPLFEKERKTFLLAHHIKHPNMLTYTNLMNSTNEKLLNNLSLFAKRIMNIIRT